MLEPSQYNDPNLDPTSRNQLFKKLVEAELKEIREDIQYLVTQKEATGLRAEIKDLKSYNALVQIALDKIRDEMKNGKPSLTPTRGLLANLIEWLKRKK